MGNWRDPTDQDKQLPSGAREVAEIRQALAGGATPPVVEQPKANRQRVSNAWLSGLVAAAVAFVISLATTVYVASRKPFDHGDAADTERQAREVLKLRQQIDSMRRELDEAEPKKLRQQVESLTKQLDEVVRQNRDLEKRLRASTGAVVPAPPTVQPEDIPPAAPPVPVAAVREITGWIYCSSGCTLSTDERTVTITADKNLRSVPMPSGALLRKLSPRTKYQIAPPDSPVRDWLQIRVAAAADHP